MDPASLFLLYLVGMLCLWLAATSVRSVLSGAAHVGSLLPTARPVMALVISAVLLLGMARSGAASGSVGPANQRMEQMADAPIAQQVDTLGTVSPLHDMAAKNPTHVVVSGDSLWRIARSVLSEDGSTPTGSDISDLWRSIYELNIDVIGKDPNLIHPGQVLQLPGR